MAHKFRKRIFSPRLFLKDIGFLFINLPHIFTLLKFKTISKVFMEKIMTIVTAVNVCTYCTWFHAKQAVSCGISRKEVKNMLNLQFKADASGFELTGLLYAQHFAETDRKPDNVMTRKLFDYYGKKTAVQILLIIRLIYFGNLSGNTFDAFLSRLKGNKAEKSNVFFEFFFFILSAPILLPLMPFIKRQRMHTAC